MSFKTFITLFLLFAVIASLAGGYVYFSMEKKKQHLQQELTLILEHARKGEDEAALTRMRPVIGLLKEAEDADKFSAQYMQILQRCGRGEEARDEALSIIKNWPAGAPAIDAHLLLGNLALEDPKGLGEAKKHFDIALADSPTPAQRAQAKTGQALIDARQGRDLEAQQALFALLDEPSVDQAALRQVEDALGDINLKFLLSRAPQPDDISYKLQKGDTLDVIARQHGLTPEVLIQCNNIQNPRRVPVNSRIKIPNVDFSLKVDKFTNELILLNHGKFFKKYPVRTGRYADETPAGEFKILDKKIDPRWTDPNTGKVYEPRDPANELGTRWLAFQGSMLGIHGTIRPETIGHYTSNGCVGMLQEDVEELFDLVREGTPLVIVGAQNPKLKEIDEQ